MWGADGDLRSDRVLGRETTHPFHGGHRRHDWEEVQAARSFFCRAESASVADSAEWVLVRRGGEPGDLRSNRVHGEDAGTIRADTGVCPYAYKSRM